RAAGTASVSNPQRWTTSRRRSRSAGAKEGGWWVGSTSLIVPWRPRRAGCSCGWCRGGYPERGRGKTRVQDRVGLVRIELPSKGDVHTHRWDDGTRRWFAVSNTDPTERPVLITAAARSLDEEFADRKRKYIIMMSCRFPCLILAGVFYHTWWLALAHPVVRAAALGGRARRQRPSTAESREGQPLPPQPEGHRGRRPPGHRRLMPSSLAMPSRISAISDATTAFRLPLCSRATARCR